MSDERKRAGIGFIAVAIAVVVLAYSAAFGPACYLTSRSAVSPKCVWTVFRPFAWLGVYGPDHVRQGITAYAGLWCDEDPDKLGVRLWFTSFEFEQMKTKRK